MKLISAAIEPEFLAPVLEALRELDLISITVTAAEDAARQHPRRTSLYGPVNRGGDLSAAVLVELVADDDDLESALAAITDCAAGGANTEGVIWTTDVTSVMRVGQTDPHTPVAHNSRGSS